MAQHFKDYGINIVHISELTFKFKVDDSAFAVWGFWKGQELSLVRGTIVPIEQRKEFIIDDFFFKGPNSFSVYYIEINKIAKAHGRTVAGIVMEIIKGAMAEGDHLRVGADAWMGLQGATVLESAPLKLAAREMLGEVNEEEYDLEEAKAYLENRYRRLFPAGKVSREVFLRNIRARGWYGAWLPDVSTEKENVITTAVPCNK